ncbi:MAG: serine/threonine protein kinase, partial [Chloroflexi bacterium]|nr:serine/threonine protein kinase [Chloroflexota bacterium]
MTHEQIGHYQIRALLGQGAMGEVYRAYDPRLDREVALKRITPPDSVRYDEWRQRFRREVRAAARLNHPHIVTVHDVDLESDPPYVVMEWLAGGTMKEWLREHKPLSWTEVLTLLRPLCEALVYAHQAGIIHRDVKPANVMFVGDEAKTLKLVDFGLARWETSSQVTQSGVILGTLAYMSPEQARGEAVDARTDIFALGIILFEALCGHNPIDKGSLGQTLVTLISPDPIDLAPLAGQAPPQLLDVIGRALSKERDQRYSDCETLGRDMVACLGQAPLASLDDALQTGRKIASPPAMRRLWLLGPARVDHIQQAHGKAGEIPRFRSRRTVALLGYLATERRSVARDFLA